MRSLFLRVLWRTSLRTVRFVSFLLLLSLFLWSACLPACAEDAPLLEMPQEFDRVQEALPDEVLEQLPEGMTADNTEEQAAALSEMLSLPYLFGIVERGLGEALESGIRLFAVVCGLLVISAVFGTIRSSFSSEGLQNTVRFCTVGGLFAALICLQYEQLSSVVLFFQRLQTLMGAMIPVGGMLLAMGGNVMTAASGTATLGVFLSICEGLCAKSVVPVCAIGTALALCQSLSPEMGLRGVANTIRKSYTFILGLVMSLLSFLLSAQTTFCAASDSATARTAKLVSGLAIPIVGGGVGDSLRVVAGSVQYLKSIVGIGGIFFILLLLLPTLLSLIVTRLVFLLGSGVAELLGCETEGKLLSEMGSVWGTMIAVVAMCSVMFILALGIFVHVTVAVG